MTLRNHRTLWGLVLGLAGALTGPPSALYTEPYELSKSDVMEPKTIASAEVSLFGVKLGDSEANAVQMLVTEKIAGINAEQESTFIFLLDQRKPTGPMAGVRIQDVLGFRSEARSCLVLRREHALTSPIRSC